MLLRYALTARRTLALIGLLTLSASALAILEPWPMKVLVDNVLTGKPFTGAAETIAGFLPGAESRGGLLAWVAVAGLVLFALGSALEILLTDRWVRAGQRITYSLAADVFGRLQRRSLAFHGRTSVGDSITRVMGDSWAANTIVDVLVFKPAHAILTGAGILVIMLQMNVRLTLISLLVLPPMVASSVLAGGRIRRASRARRAAQVKINSHVQQSLSGLAVIQAFAQEDVESTRFGELATESIRAEQKASAAIQLNSLGSGMVAMLGLGTVLWMGSQSVLAGQLTIGGLLVFIAYLKTLQGRLRALAGVYTGLQSVDASVDRVIAALSDPEVAERPHALPIARSKGWVSLEALTFGYDPDRPVLQDVSLEAREGETIAIVGATGAGKSTLVALIPRFMDPWSGRVLLDGTDVREFRIDDLRRQVAWVPQETLLLPGTVAENIAYGKPGATRREIENAAHFARAEDFISRLPNGFDSILGERGMTLSGGERQRIAIARALVVDSPILILDEPTSALDAETDEELQAALGELRKGRTSFVIAHRLATIRTADRVIVLDHGRIVESGTHDQLLLAAGPFARMSAAAGSEPVKHHGKRSRGSGS